MSHQVMVYTWFVIIMSVVVFFMSDWVKLFNKLRKITWVRVVFPLFFATWLFVQYTRVIRAFLVYCVLAFQQGALGFAQIIPWKMGAILLGQGFEMLVFIALSSAITAFFLWRYPNEPVMKWSYAIGVPVWIVYAFSVVMMNRWFVVL